MLKSSIARLRESSISTAYRPCNSPWQVIFWWEKRRLDYNMVIGSIGMIACCAMFVIGLPNQLIFGMPIGWPETPVWGILGAMAYGFFANACYTLGWVAELFFRMIRIQKSEAFGIASFTYGVVFSALLTISPPLIVIGLELIALASHNPDFFSTEAQ